MKLNLIGRKKLFFEKEVSALDKELYEIIKESSFLIVEEQDLLVNRSERNLKRSPKILHVVDISENNLVELVRDLRSSIGYIPGEFKTYVLDVGLKSFKCFFQFIITIMSLIYRFKARREGPFTL